jgi:phage-related protein
MWYIVLMGENFEVEVLEPARAFMDTLLPRMRVKAHRAIAMLEQFGYRLTEPVAKMLENAEGLRELRIQFASDICRLFYFHYRNKIYVVTSGYIKKEQKTKRNEIERALRIKKQFIEDRGGL